MSAQPGQGGLPVCVVEPRHVRSSTSSTLPEPSIARRAASSRDTGVMRPSQPTLKMGTEGSRVVAGFEIIPPLASRARTLRPMTILRERQVWRRAKPLKQGQRPGARIDRLTPAQEANVRAWLGVLHTLLRSWPRVANALHISLTTVERVLAGRRRPTVGWALRLAEAAGVPVDDVLSGKLPKPESCPLCRRCEPRER